MGKNYDYDFEMENFYSDTCKIFGYDNSFAYVHYYSYNENRYKLKKFSSYEKAYNFCYNLGFRE